MPIYGRFELNVTVATQEELDKIAEAVYSGLAEACIKDVVLWNGALQGKRDAVRSESNVELKRIDTGAELGTSLTPIVEKKERVTGVMGRGRMGRRPG